MRTISTRQTGVLAGKGRAEHLKVEIKDGGGTFRDLSSYPGFDAVADVEISDDVDSPHATASVTLIREMNSWSIAPLHETSAANTQYTPGGSYNPLIFLNRELKISVAIEPADTAAVEYMEVFRGYVDQIKGAEGEMMTVSARDLGGRLSTRWIEKERIYAYGEVSGVGVSMRVWEPNTAYALNEYVTPTEARREVSGATRFYKVTTAGTTDDYEPGVDGNAAWPSSSTVTNGSVVFTHQGAVTTSGVPIEEVIANVLADNGGLATLYTPVSPSWNVIPYIQTRDTVMECLRTIAAQLGWDIRYKWRSGTAQFELTLFEPDRAKTVPDYTFSMDDYEDVKAFDLDISGIRNRIIVIYSDAADTYPDGVGKRKTVVSEDSTSQTTYGVLTMEISESDTSLISSSTEADRMADAVLADLKDPLVIASADLVHGFPWVELGDLYRFTANGRHHTSDGDLAVTAFKHRWADGRMTTSLSLRGKPSVGFERWHSADAYLDEAGQHVLSLFGTNDGMSPEGNSAYLPGSRVIGGGQLIIPPGTRALNAHASMYEYHVSDTPDAVPSSATFAGLSADSTHTVSHLVPGKTYYGFVVPRAWNGDKAVAGSRSDDVEFVAGQGNAGHLIGDVEWGRLPLNGGFETQTDPDAPPDHWEVLAGTWDTDILLVSDGSGLSGANYISFPSGADNDSIKTADFSVDGGETYMLDFYSKSISGTGDLIAVVYTDIYNRTSSSTLASVTRAISGSGGWFRSRLRFTVGVNDRWCWITFTRSTGTCAFDIDQVRVSRYIPVVQEAATGLSFGSGWADTGGGAIAGGYWLTSDNRVQLQGTVSRTSGIGTTIATLPSGYWPSGTVTHIVSVGGLTAGFVSISTTGVITLASGGATAVSLDGISFRLVGT